MIVMQEAVWYEDRKRETEREKDMSKEKREREQERYRYIEDILTVYSSLPGLHTSGTE